MNRVEAVGNIVPLQHVLVSVYDKSGLRELISGILELFPGCTFYSTGGTYAAIAEILGDDRKKNLVSVSGFTGQPEMQGGLVKTLDFKIYLGLLSEPGNADHIEDIKRVDGVNFDAVVGNLYPFTDIISREGTDLEDARGNIDIGGPCMIRASAKNYLRVLSMCEPSDYPILLRELQEHKGTTLEFRFSMAKKAFSHTGEYDAAIATYFSDTNNETLNSTYNR